MAIDPEREYTEAELVRLFTWWRDTWHCRANRIFCLPQPPEEDWGELVELARRTEGPFAARLVQTNLEMVQAAGAGASPPPDGWHNLCVLADRLEPPEEQGYARGFAMYPLRGEVHGGDQLVAWRRGWHRGHDASVAGLPDLETIQYEVGAWSRANFNDQQSKAYTLQGLDGELYAVPLRALAPLLGMVEENAEFLTASSPSELVDAVGDILVYLCDWACREGFVLPAVENRNAVARDDIARDLEYTPEVGVAVAIGRLCRITLKRHQGIRGYNDDRVYATERGEQVQNLLTYLDALLYSVCPDLGLLWVLRHVWQGVVAKRDWKKAPDTGTADKAPSDPTAGTCGGRCQRTGQTDDGCCGGCCGHDNG